jgi:hypothetical protein
LDARLKKEDGVSGSRIPWGSSASGKYRDTVLMDRSPGTENRVNSNTASVWKEVDKETPFENLVQNPKNRARILSSLFFHRDSLPRLHKMDIVSGATTNTKSLNHGLYSVHLWATFSINSRGKLFA